jgi:hypothetical protein
MMKRLDLDFGRPRRAAPWVGRVLLALALAFAADVGLSYRDARGSLEQSEARLAAAQPRHAPSRKVSAEEVAAARETVQRLGLPWERLFRALESAASGQVALLGIEPDAKAGTVVITGDSKDYLAALSYVLDLGQAGALTRVQLVRHGAGQNDPNGPVNFAVSAAWTEGSE